MVNLNYRSLFCNQNDDFIVQLINYDEIISNLSFAPIWRKFGALSIYVSVNYDSDFDNLLF
jgi:hypothetical protein